MAVRLMRAASHCMITKAPVRPPSGPRPPTRSRPISPQEVSLPERIRQQDAKITQLEAKLHQQIARFMEIENTIKTHHTDLMVKVKTNSEAILKFKDYSDRTTSTMGVSISGIMSILDHHQLYPAIPYKPRPRRMALTPSQLVPIHSLSLYSATSAAGTGDSAASNPASVPNVQPPTVNPVIVSSYECKESVISNWFAKLVGGQREVKVDAGRADVATKTTVYEVKKWSSWMAAMGQVVTYNKYLQKSAICCVLFGRPPKQDKIDAIVKTLRSSHCNLIYIDEQWNRVELIGGLSQSQV